MRRWAETETAKVTWAPVLIRRLANRRAGLMWPCIGCDIMRKWCCSIAVAEDVFVWPVSCMDDI